MAVDQIVAAARVNKRMVYHYFGSKDAIFEAALEEVYGRIESIELHAIERGRNPREKLTRLLESYFQFLEQNPEFTRMLLWENLEKGRQTLKVDHPLTKNPFLQRFREVVEEGVSIGEFRSDINVPHLLINLIGLCFIYHSNRVTLSHSLNLDLNDAKVRDRGLDQVLELVFEGISSAAPAAAQATASVAEG